MTWRLSGDHTIATAAVRYTGYKVFSLMLVLNKRIFHTPGNGHGMIVPCPQPLLNFPPDLPFLSAHQFGIEEMQMEFCHLDESSSEDGFIN